jgi:hypothetical protein
MTMNVKRCFVTALAACCTLAASTVLAVDGTAAAQSAKEQTGQEIKKQTEERIYGSQLMTPQERAEHRTRMQAAKTAEEREQIRKEHHEKMKVRAKERGVTLPDEPPAMGMGKGLGPGGGMGPGPRGR